MEFLTLGLRLFLSAILFTSGFQKIKELDKHEGVVSNFNILPVRLVPLFSRLDPIVEVIISICIFLGFFYNYSLYFSVVLISLYTLAIIINLARGRNQISCGCGGLIGTHNLSWWLVIRNLFIISISLVLLKHLPVYFSLEALKRGYSLTEIFSVIAWLDLFTIVSFFLIISTILEFRKAYIKIKYVLLER